MKVLYDHQIFTWQRYGGISRYFYELSNYYRQTESFECDIAIKYSGNEYLKINDFFSSKRSSKIKVNYKQDLTDKIKRLIKREKDVEPNKKYAIHYLISQNFDVFHPTYYEPYFLDYLGTKPFVLTIYDMIHEIFPEYYPLYDKTATHKKILSQKATKIITISENTKSDLMKFYGISEDKIVVIYLGSSFDSGPVHIDKPINLPEKYLLFVGNRTLYKNFYFFLRSITPLFHDDKGLTLICVGGGDFSEEEHSLFKELDIEKRVIFQKADNGNLKCLYSHALAFIFPSLYEGFGIPVLEAFSCGCPVVLSNTSSLPEIALDASLYFEPKEISSIQDAVRKVIYNENIRYDLISKGFQRLKDFSWERTAKKTKEVYESLI